MIGNKLKNKPNFLILLNSVFEALFAKKHVSGWLVENIGGRMFSTLLH